MMIGRGPLAGPVVAAAVIIPLDVHIEGISYKFILCNNNNYNNINYYSIYNKNFMI